jgi:hypothetical protein
MGALNASPLTLDSQMPKQTDVYTNPQVKSFGIS